MNKLKANRLLIFILLLAFALRFYQLGHTPQGLFGDEIDAAYNAYSLLQTGRDYNGNFLPIHFESMGDYRPFLFMWALTPGIAIFGLTEFGVRFTPALWGVIGVGMIYLVVKQALVLLPEKQQTTQKFLPLFAAFLLAIVPWHLHYSRAAFEVTLMSALLLAGLWCLLKAIRTPPDLPFSKGDGKFPLFTKEGVRGSLYLPSAALLFALNAYSYNVAKLFSPLLFVICIWVFRKKLFKLSKPTLILSAVIFASILSPLAYDSTIGPGQNRFKSLNILNAPKLVEEINYQRGHDLTVGLPEWYARIFANKGVYVASLFTEQYLNAFSPRFLFTVGDEHTPRHSLPGFGLLYWWMAPLVLMGLYQSWRQRRQAFWKLIVLWLVIAPLPSAITLDGGQHATRLFIMLPPLLILSALGLHELLAWVKHQPSLRSRSTPSTSPLEKGEKYAVAQWKNSLLLVGLSLPVFLSLLFYLHAYYSVYSQTDYRWWNYGWQPALAYVAEHQADYRHIIITKSHSHLPMLYWVFYNQYPPAQLQEQFKQHQQVGVLSPTEQIGKSQFRTIAAGDSSQPENSLYVATPWDEISSGEVVAEIPSPDLQDDNPILVLVSR
jgi:4-amino-4-deoxy-L-arabinose transferase-like glycosyltransferase